MIRLPKILLAGILLIVIPIMFGGAGFLSHAADHVISDLTVELNVHVFLLGIALVAYSFYRIKG